MRRSVPLLAPVGLVIAAVALLAAVARPARAQTVREYDAKAGFLTAFTRYTTWPADTFASDSSPIVIGVLGSDPFGDVLDNTAARTVGGRPLQVRRVRSVKEAQDCHIVFIAKSESRNEDAWLAALKSRSILIVGESGHTIERGGIVEFVTVNDRIVFEVGLPAAQQAGIRLSSDLLAHARKVRQ